MSAVLLTIPLASLLADGRVRVLLDAAKDAHTALVCNLPRPQRETIAHTLALSFCLLESADAAVTDADDTQEQFAIQPEALEAVR
jgi:hypothetical protein